MHATSLPRRLSPAHPALIDRGSVIFLTGQAWGHTGITYRIQADATAGAASLLVVRRAIKSWNDALRDSPIPRIHDFRLVLARPASRADIIISVSSADLAIDGFTEIACDREDEIVEATLRLTWPRDSSPDALGVLGTYALRGIGRALGIGHAADPNDPMYPSFNGVKLRPTAIDVAAFAAVEEWYVAESPIFYPPRGYTFA